MLREKHDRFSSDRAQAEKTVTIWLDHCLNNLAHLRSLRMGPKHVAAVHSFHDMVKAGESLSPGQRRYLERMYELTFEAAGYDGCKTHVDKKPKSLRYG